MRLERDDALIVASFCDAANDPKIRREEEEELWMNCNFFDWTIEGDAITVNWFWWKKKNKKVDDELFYFLMDLIWLFLLGFFWKDDCLRFWGFNGIFEVLGFNRIFEIFEVLFKNFLVSIFKDFKGF